MIMTKMKMTKMNLGRFKQQFYSSNAGSFIAALVSLAVFAPISAPASENATQEWRCDSVVAEQPETIYLAPNPDGTWLASVSGCRAGQSDAPCDGFQVNTEPQESDDGWVNFQQRSYARVIVSISSYSNQEGSYPGYRERAESGERLEYSCAPNVI